MSIEDNVYLLNSFDRGGINASIPYTRSLKKITINGIPYYFDGLIRIVESNERFVAVSTDTSIYIIELKRNFSFSQRFAIQGCIDMKWQKN